MNIADNLRKKMAENLITISRLAEISELPVDTVKAILYHRVKDIKLSTAVKLADALNCSLDDLISRTPKIDTTNSYIVSEMSFRQLQTTKLD